MLSQELKQYSTQEFDSLYNARPLTSGIVQVIKDGQYEKKTIFRKFKSYLNQVAFDKTTGKSYMFGEDQPSDNFVELPEAFKPFMMDGYNQCTINWYEANKDFIEPHSDRTAKIYDDIKIINIFRDPNCSVDMDIYDNDGALLTPIPMEHGTV